MQLALVSGLFAQITNPEDAVREARRVAEEIARAAEAARDRDHTSVLQERFQQDQWLDEHNLRDLVVLPPIPPTLAGTQPDLPALLYPPLLADYAGEPFFMALANLYFQRLLKPVHIERIDKYRIKREELTDFVRNMVANSASSSAEDRQKFLSVIARHQQVELAALTTEAEGIRAALAGLDKGTALAKKRDSAETLKTPGLKDYLSALYAAHYEDGLSSEQRQLLQEIALESLLAESKNPGSATFFLPSSARVHWPELPPTAQTGMEQFASLRANLREELLREIVAKKGGGSKRVARHTALAASQAPRFVELERLSDEIRLAAADLPLPGVPVPGHHPTELIETVGAALDAKAGFRRHSARLASDLNRKFAPVRFKVVVENDLPAIQEISGSGRDAAVPPPEPNRRVDLAAANTDLQQRFRDVATLVESARATVARYWESLPESNRPTVAQLAATLGETHERAQAWQRLAGYREAVLLPGLSPAQRRLLFNAALRDFEKHRLATLN